MSDRLLVEQQPASTSTEVCPCCGSRRWHRYLDGQQGDPPRTWLQVSPEFVNTWLIDMDPWVRLTFCLELKPLKAMDVCATCGLTYSCCHWLPISVPKAASGDC